MPQRPSNGDPQHGTAPAGIFPICTARIGLDGRILEASPTLYGLLDISAGSLAGKYFIDIFPTTLEIDESSLRARLLDGELPCYDSDRRAVTSSGRELRLRVVFCLERHPATGKPSSLTAIIDDTTSVRAANDALREADAARREMAQRLTTAQENERTRIARELHDDIGQSLAILRIQMMRAGRPVSGMPGKLHPSLPELSETLKGIAHKVSRLSHQLHSSELEYLGLATAVQSHCREFTEKFKIPVNCVCQNIPAELDRLLALALLRVIQETLHNAAKYSQAASIEVKLTGSPTQLWLQIADDGVGFDVEEARLAAGLGLISMRERIKLAGGEYVLESRPGKGTRISARVPLVQDGHAEKSL